MKPLLISFFLHEYFQSLYPREHLYKRAQQQSVLRRMAHGMRLRSLTQSLWLFPVLKKANYVKNACPREDGDMIKFLSASDDCKKFLVQPGAGFDKIR